MIEFIIIWIILPSIPISVIAYYFKKYPENIIQFKKLITDFVFYIDKNRNQIKIYRRWKGGLWIYFYTGEWVQCEWAQPSYSVTSGYIKHPQGGMFHLAFNGIIKVEDYDNRRFYKPGDIK